VMMEANYDQIKALLKDVEKTSLTSQEYAGLISNLEKKIATDFIKSDLPLESFSFYQNAYRRVSDLEKYLKAKSLLMIGMGPVPATLIYASQNGLVEKSIGIDVDPEAVELAKQLNSKLKLKNISFEYTDGRDFSYSGFDSVFIANLVVGKAEILQKLASELPNGTSVVLRDPWGPGKNIAEVGLDSLEDCWEIEAKGEKCPNFFSQNVFLKLNQKRVEL
jgi:SAM-dependent methyltransferase